MLLIQYLDVLVSIFSGIVQFHCMVLVRWVDLHRTGEKYQYFRFSFELTPFRLTVIHWSPLMHIGYALYAFQILIHK